MGTCFSRGHTELKASFGKGNEFYQNSPVEEFNKRFFEVPIDYDNKYEVYEAINLLFLFWYNDFYKKEQKRKREENEKLFETVFI